MLLPLNGHARISSQASQRPDREVLRLCNPAVSPQRPQDTALIRSAADALAARDAGFFCALTIGDASAASETPNVISVPDKFDYLANGDLIGIAMSNGRFRVLYREASPHNSFLVTERCNHLCLMCSQPPRDVADQWILDEISRCLPLIPKDTTSLGFTGGEPLLDWRRFTGVLCECRDELPHTAVHVLSNGRAFADTKVVDAWSNIQHPNLAVGIPIYAAIDHVHDYVVQAAGAFHETLLGVLKLKDRGARVELRLVLHAITVPHLVRTCTWFARNLPFVDHVALMGLENTGFAIANEGLLRIDPVDYQNELKAAVRILSSAGVNVSIYNLPLCLIPPSVRSFAARSISDWKNGFAPQCEGCSAQAGCCGLFTSGRPRLSRGIRAIAEERCPSPVSA